MDIKKFLTTPGVWIILCIVIQLYAAFREIVQWQAFAEGLIGYGVSTVQPANAALFENGLQLLLANQGVYNLFLVAALLLWFAPFLESGERRVAGMFGLICMAVAGVFGAASVMAVGLASVNNLVVFSIQAVFPLIGLYCCRRRGT